MAVGISIKPKKNNTLVTVGTSRYRARKILGEGNCSLCGNNKNIDAHHIDENPLNNNILNLQRLCKSCHVKIHRSKKCSLEFCQKKHKGHGYCEMHLERFKKYGDPLISKINGNIIKLNK